MKQGISLKLIGIAVFITLLTIAPVACRKEPAQSKPSVVLYCSVDEQLAKPIIEQFEQRTGIEVRARYDTEATKTVGLVQKIRAEAAKPIADVFWSSEVFNTIRLANESLLSPHTSQQTKDWPANFKDPNNLWHGFALRVRVIAYNTERVPADQAPRTLEDALDPKFKGRLAMAAPEFGTTGGDVASWFVHYGPQRAAELLTLLKKNGVILVDGNSTAVRMVATGQADICFTDTDDVYAAQRNDWPVDMNYLDQGGDGPLAIPNTAALLKGAPHPQQAKALMDFLLSEELEKMLAQSYSHNAPVHPSLAGQFDDYAVSRTLEADYDEIADNLQRAIETAGRILR
jgi:iron(III) transport system substrate-binding protein